MMDKNSTYKRGKLKIAWCFRDYYQNRQSPEAVDVDTENERVPGITKAS